MKNWMKVILGVALSFMVLFTSIGYAALTDTLSIWGRAEVTVPEGLFIIAMDRESYSNLDVCNHSFLPYSTVADVQLSNSRRNTAGSARYKITVFNGFKLRHNFRNGFRLCLCNAILM